ncbi:hypothetical protein K1719_001667 [Acacia pycnantha]|nr:hypothetical protein K1719_001667 [Acacia pycnantha]
MEFGVADAYYWARSSLAGNYHYHVTFVSDKQYNLVCNLPKKICPVIPATLLHEHGAHLVLYVLKKQTVLVRMLRGPSKKRVHVYH